MTVHIPVLLESSITALDIHHGDIVVDGTFGGGGHTGRIHELFGSNITQIAVDLDEHARDRFEKRFAQSGIIFVQANFKDVADIMKRARVTHVNRVLLDLGTSVFQLLDDDRGFSFMSDAPLAMTFSHAGSHTGFTAATIVNEWAEETIADIIYHYGEDTAARKIARAIVQARTATPIETSRQLAEIIEHAVPRRGKIHPATKTFQALRIATNDELGVIEEALNSWWRVLAPGGRISVITFHSLEDRVVKRWMIAQEHKRVTTKKPLTPDKDELQTNPRSRSAKLRTIEKVSESLIP